MAETNMWVWLLRLGGQRTRFSWVRGMSVQPGSLGTNQWRLQVLWAAQSKPGAQPGLSLCTRSLLYAAEFFSGVLLFFPKQDLIWVLGTPSTATTRQGSPVLPSCWKPSPPPRPALPRPCLGPWAFSPRKKEAKSTPNPCEDNFRGMKKRTS